MFVTIGTMTQYVSQFGGEMLLVTGNARIATAYEAADCIARLIVNGDKQMEDAQKDFNRIYGNTK